MEEKAKEEDRGRQERTVGEEMGSSRGAMSEVGKNKEMAKNKER